MKLSTIHYSLCTIFISLFSVCFTAAATEDWKEVKSEHFIVGYIEDENFAEEVSHRAEQYYSKIASDLGYSRYDNFWTWENRARIYIYRTREEYLGATGAKEWSYGFASYGAKTIVSYAHSEKFLNTLLPHELTHLIFRDFVGFKGEVPVWLDEGVAQWEEEDKRKAAIEAIKELVAKKDIIPLPRLMQMDVGEVSDSEVSFKFYVEAVTIVGFLIKQHGESKFTLFCRQLRDGDTINAALSSVYSDSIRNAGELEKEWLKYYGG
ncbi:MAG: peptidase MA family metallohydrolase [Candidatus Omnitrophica bacterium]|nr:peptidase MA family metallohydrolase [Candidatus Omnitrophota bacterium]MDD5436853.1 peptidase MA family metallohydrolase [Candidatus Omnitrophota bacterium]